MLQELENGHRTHRAGHRRSPRVARHVAAGLSFDLVRSELTPDQKSWWCCRSARTAP
jgi:hypothetical protein